MSHYCCKRCGQRYDSCNCSSYIDNTYRYRDTFDEWFMKTYKVRKIFIGNVDLYELLKKTWDAARK